MPQADGTILIDTEINADGMKAGSKEVEAAVRRMASSVNDLGTKAKTALNKQVDAFSKLNNEFAAQSKKVDELKKKVAEYGKQKIPTAEYKEIQAQIDQASQKMNRLISAQEKFLAMGGSENSKQYKKYQYDIDELANSIRYAEGEMKDLEATGKAFTLGNQTNQATADMEKLEAAERKLSDMNNRLGTSYSAIKSQVNDYKNGLLKADSAQKKASASGNRLSKSLKNTGKSANSASFGIGKMLGTSILFSFTFQAINAVLTGIKDGFANLAQYSGTTNNSISMLWSSLERLKNSLATAFAPILDVVAPILSKFIDMLSTAASYVSMFFAFLSGKSTYTRAVAVQKDYAASLQDTASGAKDAAEETEAAAEAAEDYLSPLDDINRYTEQNTGGGTGGNGGGAGSPGGAGSEGPLFEEVEITDIPILEKVKDILSSLFKPFKEAWQQEGKATIDAAKYALTSLGELAKSVGRSLMEVWTNGTGTAILSTMLRIVQNILITIGNIASRLKEAWETNKVGTRIIQAIADLLLTVMGFIERITEATAKWAENLNFYPLLESIANLLESLQPVIQAIGDFLYNIYTTIILPVAKFLIETALPAIINALSSLFEFLGEHQWIIEAVGAALIGAFAASKLVPLIMTIVSTIGKVIGIIQTVITVITSSGGLGAAISGIVSLLGGPLTVAIAAAIAAGVLLITHWEEVQEIAQKVWTFVQKKFQQFDDFLNSIFTQDFQYNFGILGDTLEGFWSGVENTWNGIKHTFEAIINFIDGVFTLDWQRTWQSVIDIFSGIFETLGGIVSIPLNTVAGLVKTVVNGIKDTVLNIADYIYDRVSGVFQGIINTIKSVINSAISIANGGIRLINSAIGGIESAISFGPWEIPTPFGSRTIGFQADFPRVPTIPYLASGAVIPPNKEFMAVLGDQNHGNNIEAPESLIRRIVREESGRSGGNKYEIPLKVGRRELARLVIDEAKIIRNETGRNPFELV